MLQCLLTKPVIRMRWSTVRFFGGETVNPNNRRLALSLCLTLAFGAANTPASDALANRAQTILEQRCVVCHACYDAPCQLKLEAHEGLLRGANDTLIYDSTRLLAGNLTRLFDDAQGEQAWRQQGFYPVLDASESSRGVLRQMLDLKQANPMSPSGPVSNSFDFSLHRDQQCPQPGEFARFAEDYPLWGMPYGLPALHADEHTTLVSWLDAGAPAAQHASPSAKLVAEIAAWEAFLNAKDNKSRLMARYVYEHLFLATLYLEPAPRPLWFRLVRSATPAGEPIDLLATRRPFDDPGKKDFYYRLQAMPITVAAKSHQPYRFDSERRNWYESLFLTPDYTIKTLPDYAEGTAGDPFTIFAALPVRSRYRFLLEDAQFTIMNFIKGPVCRGQIALNVIDDRFWVMFMDPDELDPELDGGFLEQEARNLRLPAARTGTVIDLLEWRRYARSHGRYMRAKAEYLERQYVEQGRRPGLEVIWDGDGHNPNAALTIARHVDTASVVKGFIGETPKTAWFITYSLLERIHYLLVANFDVYGAASHQLESRLYMDFLRMEGELNFLMFLPSNERQALWDYWYRDAPDSSREHPFVHSDAMQRETALTYVTDDPKAEFLGWMRERLHGAIAESFDYHRSASPAMAEAFDTLVQSRGTHNSFLPAVSFVNVIGTGRDRSGRDRSGRDEAYTLLHDAGYSNIAQLFGEDKRRLPKEDAVTVVAGLIGAHPNLFFQVHEKQIPLFVSDILALHNTESLALLQQRYGVRRNSPWFWAVSDRMHTLYREQDGLAAGVLDYNRYLGY